jgi:exopolyphosphatase/pppGpp-phosphohydrolase
LLEKLSQLLGQPLQIGKGGLREGVILDLLSDPEQNGKHSALAA